jgi:hypothetical protein
VLLKAIQRVQAALDLTEEQLLAILQTDTLDQLDASSDKGKRAAKLISIYQSLYAYVGDDKKTLSHWVSTQNRSLGASPVNVMSRDSGLDRVIAYLTSRGA